MRVVGVNGIRTHGDSSTDVVLRLMKQQGFETVDVPLPWRSVFTARFGGKKDGEIVADHSRDGDIVVCHSFGCLRTWWAQKLRDYAAIICIAPAMERKARWCHPERVHCWFSPDDWTVRAGTFLFLHPFGSAGTKGFRDPKIKHHLAPGAGHGSYFRDSRFLRDISNTIHDIARGSTWNNE